MSVQRYETADGTRWRVRWRESTGRMRSTTVPSKRDATALDAGLKARKFKGEALPQRSKDTLAGAYEQWRRLRAPDLAPQTVTSYQYVWNAHVSASGFDTHRLARAFRPADRRVRRHLRRGQPPLRARCQAVGVPSRAGRTIERVRIPAPKGSEA